MFVCRGEWKGVQMGVPSSNDVMAYMLDARANALGHAALGILGRRTTNIVLWLSAGLSAVAGAGVLAEVFSKTTVGFVSLAAAIASLTAIACLQTLKFDQHLRLQGEYESVSARLVGCYAPKPGREQACDERFKECVEDFNRALEHAGSEKAALSDRRVEKCRKKARRQIMESTKFSQELKESLPPTPIAS